MPPPGNQERRESAVSGWGMSLAGAVPAHDSFYDPRNAPPHG